MAKIAELLVYDRIKVFIASDEYVSKIPQSATIDFVVSQLYLRCFKCQATSSANYKFIINFATFSCPIFIQILFKSNQNHSKLIYLNNKTQIPTKTKM